MEKLTFIFVCKSNTMFSVTAELLLRYELSKIFPQNIINNIDIKSAGVIKIFGKERSKMHKLFKDVLTRNNIPGAEKFLSQLYNKEWFEVSSKNTYVYALDSFAKNKLDKISGDKPINSFIEGRMFDDIKNTLSEEETIKIINEIGTRVLTIVEGIKRIYGLK